MTIYVYDDYKAAARDWVSEQPNQGYGVYSRMAKHLGTTSVVISQIFRGSRDLNLEHAVRLASFMHLGAIETDYFLLLVQFARAGSHDLKKVLMRQLDEIRLKGQAVKHRINHSQLSDQDKAIFYSSWYYVAIWLAAPIGRLNSVGQLASNFQLPEQTVSETLRFLLDKGLLIKKGRTYDFGENVIHVSHDSPFAVKHHANWRIKALQSMDRHKDDCLHYSAPMSLSEADVKKIREDLLQFIQKQTKRAAASPSEKTMCLSIDWFDF